MMTALDTPDDVLDEQERDVVRCVREHGWFDHRISGEDELPAFNFSTGFHINLKAPEIIVFALNPQVAHNILWEIYRQIKDGLRLEIGKPYGDFIEGFDVYFQPVDKSQYEEHLGWSRWFYGGDDFDCWQMIWPDKQGRFPWQQGYNPAFVSLQPDLSRKGWVAKSKSSIS